MMSERDTPISVILIAELRIPQCTKYRVDQKRMQFECLGIPCRIIDWFDTAACLEAAASATMAILYRVPADPPVLTLIEHLRARGVMVVWEVDDLIFDDETYRRNSNMESLSPDVRDGNLNSVRLLRTAMLACDAGIASTPHLAHAMRAAGLSQVAVVENALDEQTTTLASRLRPYRRTGLHAKNNVLITYGSGNPSHDSDFRQATPALLRLLDMYSGMTLRIIGEVNLSPDFARYGKRIERLPIVPFDLYMPLLAESDISIAPLEPTEFNDAKSNIKFIEASILGIPSVCSSSAHFVGIIDNRKNGFTADDDSTWFAALSALAKDAGLRYRLGRNAMRTVRRRYDLGRTARSQLMPLVKRLHDARRALM